jgi:hypothetical protein
MDTYVGTEILLQTFLTSHQTEIRFQLPSPANLPTGNKPPLLMDRKAGGPHGQVGFVENGIEYSRIK